MTNLISEVTSTIKNWWLFLILGTLLVVGGIWVFTTPAASYLALTVLFVVLLLVNGIFQIIFSVSNKDELTGWGWYLTGGILEFLIGIYLWSYPALAMGVLVFVVGFWLLFRGISVIAHSTDLKSMGGKGWGWLLFLGILMTIFSFFIIMDPVFGGISVVYLTGFAMLFMGFAYIMFSIKLSEIKSKAKDIMDKTKEDVGELKAAVMDHLKNVNPEIKDKVSKMFDEYDK